MYKLKTVLRGIVQLSAYEDNLKSKQILSHFFLDYCNLYKYTRLSWAAAWAI